MTPRISIVTAVAALALAVGAPAAYGDNWGADRQDRISGIGSPDREDRALLAQQNQTATMLDARERAFGTKQAERATVPTDTRPVVADGGDRFRIDGSTGGVVTVGPVESGRDVEWPTIGFAIGLGALLALGLFLLVWTGRGRPLAH
jgi:hypothetical protein